MLDRQPYPYTNAERLELLPFLPTTASRILDVGCGTGGFSRAAKARTPDLIAWGIEANPNAAAAAESHLDSVITGSFPDDMPAEVPPFDVVFFNDVLEHMVDPWAALVATQPMITPGGCVVASLPNLRHYKVLDALVRRGDFTYTDVGILDRTHLRFFTRSTMTDMFTSTGYEVTSCTPISVAGSRLASLVARLPWMSLDILAQQFVIVATPVGRIPDALT
jgi:2-polyprenyl-3-methyl-5-hydroxy-6-metoxy-1,4-benzoquinol methylase